MRDHSNVTLGPPITERAASGIGLGALAVLGFSGSLPATRLAVMGLDPWLVAFGRATAAGLLAIAYLCAIRAPRPVARDWPALAVVAGGVVIGFPLLTSLALGHRTAAHVTVGVAVLPIATAVAAVARAGERLSARFWAASVVGMVAGLAFLATRGGSGLAADDLFILGAVAACAIGYAEGGAVSRRLGGPRTIAWALVLALPITAPIAAYAAATRPDLSAAFAAPATAWLGFAYVSLISMFLGFFAWYAALARGGVARIAQLQLAQPVLSLVWSALFLGERVDAGTIVGATAVLLCVVATQRTR